MGLDRDDLAARNMVAAIRTLDAEVRVPPTLADFAVECADALIARLRPATVAQVADTPEPRRTVGAVVRPSKPTWNDNDLFAVVSSDEKRCQRWLPYHKDRDDELADFYPNDDVFVRWATREECERHGLSWVERGAAPSPAASPAAYVPKVGDRVMHAGPDDGRRFVVTAVDAFAVIRVDSKRSAFCVSGPWIDNAAPVYDGPATAAERAAAGLPPITPDHPQGGQGAEAEGRVGDQRVAAGLDAPAVDREGLARALRVAYQNATIGSTMGPWEESSESARKGYLAEADAAIAFLKANGGAS